MSDKFCKVCGCYIPSMNRVCPSCSAIFEEELFGIYKISDPTTHKAEFTGVIGTKEEVIDLIGNHYSYSYKKITPINSTNKTNDRLLNKRFLK